MKGKTNGGINQYESKVHVSNLHKEKYESSIFESEEKKRSCRN